ncbi:Cytosolic Fe-S cluster assembly factor NUBP2 [Astathelohania contejeani]|uniref:Cytosolic Fe-S cluster assembly factor NUBP2 n=1 Tax=Astathelohania contejeani TaxID=164912 RepID=A0ABQ7I093_9MICR|nr:Cytosolic Fe-S cluster assembly factor NUBP2 [Thelohania contejeani]
MAKIYTVMSGKGGVGKSSISIMVATILSQAHRVLLLDFDVAAPSVSCGFKITGKVIQGETGLIPIRVTPYLYVLSMALMTNPEDAIIWRAPKKIITASLFFDAIRHDNYDYVVIDTPPGITELHEFIADKKEEIEALIVTTPQNIALSDTLSSIEFCKSRNIKIKWLVENMSGFTCENCGVRQNIFASKGGEILAKEMGVIYIGAIPIEPMLGKYIDDGIFLDHFKSLKAYEILKDNVF